MQIIPSLGKNVREIRRLGRLLGVLIEGTGASETVFRGAAESARVGGGSERSGGPPGDPRRHRLKGPCAVAPGTPDGPTARVS